MTELRAGSSPLGAGLLRGLWTCLQTVLLSLFGLWPFPSLL